MAKEKGKKPPAPPKPWDVPRAPARGDADKMQLFAAVGGALSSWETLEEQLAQIFSDLVSSHFESLPAQRAYGSVLTFRGRSEMIAAAANAVFFQAPNEALHKTLTKLLNDAGSFSARRNEIAHGKISDHYQQRFFSSLHAATADNACRLSPTASPILHKQVQA